MKTVTKWGVMAKVQSAFDTAATLDPATDGIRTIDAPNCDVKYSYDGMREGKAPGTAGRLAPVGPEGRYGECTIKQEGAGGGAAYSATVVPVVHTLLRLAGFDAALTSTAGSEGYVYTPADEPNYAFGTMETYEGGEKHALLNLLADTLDIGGELGHIPTWEAKCMGAYAALPTDAPIPGTLVYNGTIGAKATQMLITIADYLPVRVHEFKFSLKRNSAARAFDNLNGRHGGFHPGTTRELQVEFLMEAVAMPTASPYHTVSTFNARAMMELAEQVGLSFQVGATQYKRFKVAAPKAIIGGEMKKEAKGALAMWRVPLILVPTTESANDEIALTFD